ncbi:hypothetical protein [Falsihalocynthiibacter arcticus]|uniref:Uncharacterized protein n=1 Tax=Falsihalocynthiibacter arcticus TaxID=1579316 RepID=A0A126V040_9RHOB|nr:hypothetical protein [Falsihalocynthiibacter arcticus]AML51698.1 hypothetical protein RC74_10875 [Falsihalocynthiibacter arcticus]
MSIQPSFDNAIPVNIPVAMPPAVLRFAPFKPKQLSRFKMHDRRSGGDLSHIDLTKKTLNKIEHGCMNWIPKLKRRIARMAKRNCKNEVRALKAKGRISEAKRRQAEGAKSPWHANTDAPLREGILTVNKSWFGGIGVDKWDPLKVETFRAYAMDFLHLSFPGSQLQYSASHSDEEAFHIHFVIAAWDRKTTGNRGDQIQLRAAANPILQSYELAQDLVGAHFEKIGITRGARSAEARRQAKEAGMPVPDKRRHVPPSEYREEECREGWVEAEAIKKRTAEDCIVARKKTRQRASRSERAARRKTRQQEAKLDTFRSLITDAKTTLSATSTACKKAETARDAAIDTAKLTLEGARDTATKTVRKSRARAIRDANARKVEAERLFNASEAKRKVEECAVQDARKNALGAQTSFLSAVEQVGRCVEQAETAAKIVVRERDNLTTVTAELKQAETLRDAAIHDTEVAQKATIAATGSRNAQLAEAEDAKKSLKEAEAAMRLTEERADTIAVKTDALEYGLEYVANGLLTYSSATEDKDERLVFTKSTPTDPTTHQSIYSRIRPAMTILVDIGRLIFDTVHELLARERAVIAQDIQTLDEIRKEMGIDANESLDTLKARYDAENEMPSL